MNHAQDKPVGSPTLLYYIADTSDSKASSDITERLQQAYDADPIGTWSLEYRLYRSTPQRQDDRDLKLKNLLRLNLEHGRGAGNAYIWYCDAAPAPTDAPAANGTARRASLVEREQLEKVKERENVLAIPSAQLPGYSRWLNSKMTALWTPRSALYVAGGSSYAIEDESVIVRIGELRQQGPAGQQQNVKGVIVSLEEMGVVSENDEMTVDSPAEHGAGKGADSLSHLTQVWKGFGSEDTKQFRPSSGQQVDENEVVRMYCELLRLRG